MISFQQGYCVCVQIIKSDNVTSTVLTVVLITAVYIKDIPKGSRTTSKDSQFVHAHPKDRYFKWLLQNAY